MCNPFDVGQEGNSEKLGGVTFEQSTRPAEPAVTLPAVPLCPFRSSSRIPAPERCAQFVIETLYSNLEQQVRAALAPAHLLLLDHAGARQLIHR